MLNGIKAFAKEDAFFWQPSPLLERLARRARPSPTSTSSGGATWPSASKSRDDHVAVLTLDEPKVRNALTAETRIELRDALETLAADTHVHALVITGAGGNFCAGGDVRTMGETDIARIDERMNDVARTAETVRDLPAPGDRRRRRPCRRAPASASPASPI